MRSNMKVIILLIILQQQHILKCINLPFKNKFNILKTLVHFVFIDMFELIILFIFKYFKILTCAIIYTLVM